MRARVVIRGGAISSLRRGSTLALVRSWFGCVEGGRRQRRSPPPTTARSERLRKALERKDHCGAALAQRASLPRKPGFRPPSSSIDGRANGRKRTGNPRKLARVREGALPHFLPVSRLVCAPFVANCAKTRRWDGRRPMRGVAEVERKLAPFPCAAPRPGREYVRPDARWAYREYMIAKGRPEGRPTPPRSLARRGVVAAFRKAVERRSVATAWPRATDGGRAPGGFPRPAAWPSVSA